MVRVFTGPSLVAKGVTAALLEEGIQPIERNDHDSSLLAGFTASIPDQVQLFVREDQEHMARKIVKNFLEP